MANCYDSVAHPIASIALQSFKVRVTTVTMMLYVLQTMNFYPKTGYRQSQESYDGTKDVPIMGLAQGNGTAPPGFLSVSTLMINTYKHLGHWVNFVGAWSGDAFYLAAVLFVDDSNLFYMVLGHMETDQEFVNRVHHATFGWEWLVQALGGSLKPSTCFWYMLSWKWMKGQAQLKILRQPIPHPSAQAARHGGQSHQQGRSRL